VTCIICHFDTEPDDAWVLTGTGKCICVLCWERETGIRSVVPHRLQDEIERIMAGKA
jgi:hypothetical protein